MGKIKVLAPCSSANLGSGFDVFGLALEAFHDSLTVELIEDGITIDVKGLDADKVPTEVDKNTAGVVAKELLRGRDVGVKIVLEKGIPLNMGLGSSGASAAAAAAAINSLFGLGLSENELVKVAAIGEMASAGASHADNVAASLLGGFTMVQTSGDSLFAVRLDPPSNLEVALAMPLIETPRSKTAMARAILPKLVPLESVVSNVRNASLIVAGFHFGDVDIIGRGMTDVIVEPVRMRLIPNYESVKRAALDAGASGVAISGAGPSMIAVVDNLRVSADEVAKAMKDAFLKAGVECKAFSSKPSLKGVTKIS